jgi:CheY-like chemotaxis protein
LSLTGNLEDLPLLDILQIVSFSKRTGYLSIQTGEREGAIIFRDGFVVGCFTSDTPPLDAGSLQLSAPQRGALIRSRIEIALAQLTRLHEGQFNFSLADEPPTKSGARDVSRETLDTGINPQELVLDLARGIDEDRRNSSAAIEVSFAQPEEDSFEVDLSRGEPGERPLEPIAGQAEAEAGPLPGEAEPPRTVAAGPAEAPPPKLEEIRTILLVDDEADIRQILAERLTTSGYEVEEAEEPDEAIKQAQHLRAAGTPFLLLVDLGMPTSGGSSFHGGFEVAKRMAKMHLHPPALLMSDSAAGSIQARARQMGIGSVVFKPGLSRLDPEQFQADMHAFADRIVTDILPKLVRPGMVAPKPAARREPTRLPAPPGDDDLSRQFTLLQRHLGELRQPHNANQIAALVMQAAREFFERGILLLVKNEEARGLGGFGRSPREEKLSLVVRDVTVPLRDPSTIRNVVASGKPFAGPIPDGRWEQYLFGKVGRYKSGTFALLPLLAHRETIAVLIGDNPETGRELGRLDALEVFVSQAGIAFENVFLQRKIEALQRG